MDAISFGTDGWRAPLSEFTAPRVRMVAQAVATHLQNAGRGGDPVAVGYDARESSRGFAEEVARVLAAAGHDVLLPDRDVPTPLVAYAVHERDLAGGVAITASHNPPDYNGIKFLPAGGAPALPAVSDEIEANLATPSPAPESEWGTVREVDFRGPHADHVMDLVGADLSGLAVAYDAMHGSGRDVTDALLEAAGAEVRRIRCERDPEFGGASPEPRPGHLDALVDAVTDGGADLGVANDGDADRIAVVTPRRGHLDENRFFAAVYDHLLVDDAGPAVRTVSTTFLIDRVAEAHGETAVETPVGFKWVAGSMGDHDALMGGEESGGFTVRGHVRNKDGVLMAMVAAAAERAEPLDDRVDRLLDEHGEIHQDRVSVDCPDDRKRPVLDELSDAIPDAVAGTPIEDVVTKDGFKLLLSDGSWLLVRPSGTEPKLRVYAEAGDARRVERLLSEGRRLIEPLI
ncbi:MAG: phosphoglucomutase/phosphomannomutase family protein [Halobacteriales archaeon]